MSIHFLLEKDADMKRYVFDSDRVIDKLYEFEDHFIQGFVWPIPESAILRVSIPIIDPKLCCNGWMGPFPAHMFSNSSVRSQRRKAVSSNSLEMTWHLWKAAKMMAEATLKMGCNQEMMRSWGYADIWWQPPHVYRKILLKAPEISVSFWVSTRGAQGLWISVDLVHLNKMINIIIYIYINFISNIGMDRVLNQYRVHHRGA